MREPRRAASARQACLRDLLKKPRQQPVAQPGEARRLARDLDAREIGRDAHAGDRRQILGAGPIAALLSAADGDRGELDGGPHPEGAGPRRPVQVVGRERQQVDVAVVDEERHAPGGADRVDVERHAAPTGAPTDLPDRLDGADLAVGRHDRDEHRVVADRPRHRVRVDAPVAVDTHVGDGPSPLLEVAARVDQRNVLDRGGDDVPAGGALGQALDGEVVRLGGAGGEDHPRRRPREQPRHLGSSPVQ